MPHTGLAAPGLTGIELWSFVTDTAERVRSVREGLLFAAAPLRVLDHPPAHNMIEWDRMCASRRVVALGGLDAHQIGVRLRGRVPLRLMGYARSFRQLRTHVLCSTLPVPARWRTTALWCTTRCARGAATSPSTRWRPRAGSRSGPRTGR